MLKFPKIRPARIKENTKMILKHVYSILSASRHQLHIYKQPVSQRAQHRYNNWNKGTINVPVQENK